MSGPAPSVSPVRQFFRSSGMMAMLYAGSTGLTFVVGVVLARLLGAADYGIYALALTTATLVGTVTEFGLPVLAMREVGAARASGNWSELRGLLQWSDRAIALLSLLLIAGTYAAVARSDAAQDSAYLAAMLWAVLLIPFVAIGKLRSFVLLALDHVFSSQFAVMILRPLVFLVLCLILAWQSGGQLSATTALIAQLAGAVAAMAAVLWLYHRYRPRQLAGIKPHYAVREWLGACLPMGLTEGLRVLQGQLALLLVGWLAGAAAAGVYRVADAVMQVTALASSIVGTAATPLFGRLFKQGDSAGLERVAVLAALVMAGGALLLGLPLALAGQWIFPLVFGADFAASAAVFTILWLGAVLAAGCGLVLAVANMTGQHVLSTQSFMLIALANLVLGAWLIPAHGAEGAAFASAVALVLGNGFCAIRLKQRTGINATLFNPAAPGIALDALRQVRQLAASLISGTRRGE